MGIEDRLEWLRDGRRVYPWLQGLGITRGTIARMLRGQIPKSDTVTTLCRAENVSLSWLLEGSGAPFIVARFGSDQEIADHLHALMDEQWAALYAISDPGGLRALVASQPAQVIDGERVIDYTAIEVIAGPMGPRALDAVAGWRMEQSGGIHPNRLTRQQTADLIAGRLGTWRLLENPDPLLQQTPAASLGELDLHSPYSTVEDPPTVQDVADMMRVLSPELQERVKAYVEGMRDGSDSD